MSAPTRSCCPCRLSLRRRARHPAQQRCEEDDRHSVAAGLSLAVVALLGVGIALAPVCAGAALYKWVDANGKTVYSDLPPPGNVEAEVLKPPPPPANPNAAKDLQEQQKAREQAQKKKADAAAADEKTRADLEQRRAACATARGQLQLLLDPGQALVRVNEKGERVQVNDAARREEIERTQLLIRDSCKGL